MKPTPVISLRCPDCGARSRRLGPVRGTGGCGKCGARLIIDRAPKRSASPRPVASGAAKTRATKRLEEVRRHLEGFGCTVGIHGGAVIVGDRVLQVPQFVGDGAAERAIDSVVMEHFADRLLRTVDSQLGARRDGMTIDLNRRVAAVDLRVRGHLVARVSASRWWEDPGRRASGTGNFVTAGPQWDAVREHVHGPSLASSTDEAYGADLLQALEGLDIEPALPMRYAFSDTLQPQLKFLGESASRRIRSERSLAFGHVVHVRAKSGFELAFSPVLQDRGRPEVGVAYQDAKGRISLRMRVAGRSDPLAIQVPAGSGSSRVDRAWVCALLIFAELTCPPDLDHLRPATPARVAARQPARSGVASRLTTAERRRPPASRSVAPRAFEPIGETSRWMSSYVAGHRRQLPPGHAASDDAITAASAAGISLRSGETWVSPHVRGMPPGISLHFGWKAPSALGGKR
ncbi:unannotated protein [freshwater metagenome]|uniref:Unannotated protein n=1 Tax=freshwater metagenome TaxID=449393 RepID=A0A6J7FER6_9ZZZZ